MNHENKNLNHPRVEALIRELSQLMGPDANTGMFEEMFTDLALLGRENQDNSDHKLIQKTLRELRESLTLFLPFRSKRKVVVFGSRRVSDSHPNYKLAMELAQGLVHQGFQVITEAGGGIMEAANRSAGREKSKVSLITQGCFHSMEITNPEALMPLLRVLPARIRDSIKLLNLQNPPT